jgi:hypothetical protein
VACGEEGHGDNSKSNGNEGGGRAMETRVMAMAIARMRAMVMVTRWAGDEEYKGKGSKGNKKTVTRVVGEQRQWQQRRQLQQ